MQDILTKLTSLNRPRLLVRAARIGMDDYRRDVHLQRLLKSGRMPRCTEALLLLSEQEASLNDLRVNDDAGYSLARHIDVLIAMMGEARLLRQARAKSRTESDAGSPNGSRAALRVV